MNLPIRVRWTPVRVLAVTAFALGALAMAGNPVRGHRVTIDTQELATLVGTEADHVTPAELADGILRGDSDYRLIDLRDARAFSSYHIPTAENVPVASLPDFGLLRNEKVVLYSDGGIHAAQAWMLLRAQGYRGVYVLLGGLDAWRDEIVFPAAPANPTPARAAAFERAVQVAKFFGGHPREASAEGGAASLTLVAPPTAAPPAAAPPAATGRAGGKKKAKEGC